MLSYAKDGKVFLHGSRIDDFKKGGDIDIFFIVPDEVYEYIKNNKIVITAELSQHLYEQKIDLTCLAQSEESTHLFFKNSHKIEL